MTDFTIKQGSTWSRVLRWESPTITYKPISAIAKSAPVSITSATHGISDGWRVAVVSVKGMTQINCVSFNRDGSAKDTYKATVLDANTITLNNLNSAEFSTYTSGGYIQLNTPVDMTGYTARMQIKAKLADTANILSLTTDLNGGIVIDNVAKTITITLTAAQTTLLTFKTAVYSLEMVSSGGIVTELISGKLTLDKEITR